MSNFSRAGRVVVLVIGLAGVAGAVSGCAVGVSAGAGAAVTVTDTANDGRSRAATASDPYMSKSAAAAERAIAEAQGYPPRR